MALGYKKAVGGRGFLTPPLNSKLNDNLKVVDKQGKRLKPKIKKGKLIWSDPETGELIYEK